MNSEFARLTINFGWVNKIEPLGAAQAYLNPYWTSSSTTFSDSQSSGLDSAASSSWWFETRNLLIHKYVKASQNHGYLWDIGSGPGVVSGYLEKQGIPCIAVEPNRGGVLASAKRGLLSIESDLASLQIPDASVGVIGLFDVLEHIKHRDDLLREIWRVLSPDGSLLLTVPALNWLWSAADEQAGNHGHADDEHVEWREAAGGWGHLRENGNIGNHGVCLASRCWPVNESVGKFRSKYFHRISNCRH